MSKRDSFLIVTDPVANIRWKPVNGKPAYTYDEIQGTQVLYNETLRYVDEIDDWYYVEAIEQKKYSPGNLWQGYPGWIRKDSAAFIDTPLACNAVVKSKTTRVLQRTSDKASVLLTALIGTRFVIEDPATDKKYYNIELADHRKGYINKADLAFEGICADEDLLRQSIVNTGMLFLGVPYLWGGRSMHVSEVDNAGQETEDRRPGTAHGKILSFRGSTHCTVLTGVDCSGLTNLVYRVNNINIPRDAHEQWMAASKIQGAGLKPGDLIFVSADNKLDRIVHVMISMDRERFIEAWKTGEAVRVGTFAERFGEDFETLAGHNFLAGNNQISFGSVL